jgi:hypothetical protein
MKDLFSQSNGHRGHATSGSSRTGSTTKTFTMAQVYAKTVFEFESPAGEILYVQQHKGPYFHRVGEDRWANGLPPGVEQVLYGLPHLVEGARAGKKVGFFEGPKDVDTAQGWLGMVGTTSGGANTWRPGFRHFSTGLDVVIVQDNNEPGKKYALKVAKDIYRVARSVKVVLLPGLPEGGDLTDFKERGHTPEEFWEAVEQTPFYEPPKVDQDWPETKPLPTGLPPVMALHPAMLPDPLADWVFDTAARHDNSPPDYPAVGSLVEAGSLLGRKVCLRPKRYDDWQVVPNLWGALIGAPGSMKSPLLFAILKPLKRLEAQAREAYEEAYAAFELYTLVKEVEVKVLKKALEKKATEVADGKADPSAMEAIREKLAGLQHPDDPRQRRFATNDATIEKLAELLIENPDGLLNYRDELMGWLSSLDRPGHEADRAFFLESWNGDNSFNVDRIGRGSLYVAAMCLSILGGIQPGPLTRYVRDALEEGEKADGLLQRF